MGSRLSSAVRQSPDGAHDRRILDDGDDAEPAATAGTGEDIEIERTAHQRRPGPGLRGDGGAGLARESGV